MTRNESLSPEKIIGSMSRFSHQHLLLPIRPPVLHPVLPLLVGLVHLQVIRDPGLDGGGELPRDDEELLAQYADELLWVPGEASGRI